MSASDGRPRRYLAAWGYESSDSGDSAELDVWTVNPVEAEDDDGPDAEERARRAFGDRVTVVEAFGNVARVDYAGAAGSGYRYVEEDEPAPQQAFAGAKRSAGGTRTGAGTFGTGYAEPDDAPDLADVLAHATDEVLPVVRVKLRGLGRDLAREPSRDEDGEPVADEPFDGFDNVVRVFLSDETVRYTVSNGDLVRLSSGGGA
jgi:hypothetical protein